MADAIKVEGLRELHRAFRQADRSLAKDLRETLRDAADPVRSDAERLATTGIRRIGPRWSRMRVGVTQRLVYVAPKERGVKTRGRQRYRRPNLSPLLLDRALEPALDRNISEVEQRVKQMLDDGARRWARG